jgi:hypothetical protein
MSQNLRLVAVFCGLLLWAACKPAPSEVMVETTVEAPATAAEPVQKENATEETSCEEGCKQQGRTMYESCLADGGDERECGLRARVSIPDCLAEQCGEEAATGRSCEKSCGIQARTLFADCLAGGGSEPECGPKARESVPACIAEKCGDAGAEERACEVGCGLNARSSYVQCMNKDGDMATCRAQAGVLKKECIASCPSTSGE